MVRNDFNDTIRVTIHIYMYGEKHSIKSEQNKTKQKNNIEIEIERVEKSEKSKWLILIVAENYRKS